MERQDGETDKILKFSSQTSDDTIKNQKQLACYITRTSQDMHNVILENLDKSLLFNGTIKDSERDLDIVLL